MIGSAIGRPPEGNNHEIGVENADTHLVIKVVRDDHQVSDQPVKGCRIDRCSRECTTCLWLGVIYSFVSGVVLIVGGVLLHTQSSLLLAGQVEKKMTIENGHITYEQLENSSINTFKDFYFFNLTNYLEFHNTKGGVKPELQEVGPYSFIELRTKNLSETDYPYRVNYTQHKLFFYNEETSGDGLSDSDIICTINIPLIGAIYLTKDESIYRVILKVIINMTDAKLYVCEKATDLAWGYSDRFIELLHERFQLPDKIGIQVNDSAADQNPSIINTGIPDIKQVGQFIQWNGHTELDIWDGDANEIRGTEGLFFRPNLKEKDNLTSFVDDVMRSFDIVFEGKVNHLGLDAFRYGIDNTTFLSAFSEPKNADYFSWCPDGMFNLGPTQGEVEVPVFGSKPHFLDGDPLLLDSVIGLEPDREKHDTVIDIEPITGANINFRRRLQVVMQVNKTVQHGPNDTIDMTENIRGYNDSGVLYLPVVYIDEHATMDEDFKNYLDEKGLKLIRTFSTAIPAVVGILICIGVVLIFVGILTLFFLFKKIKQTPRGENIPLMYSKEQPY